MRKSQLLHSKIRKNLAFDLKTVLALNITENEWCCFITILWPLEGLLFLVCLLSQRQTKSEELTLRSQRLSGEY